MHVLCIWLSCIGYLLRKKPILKTSTSCRQITFLHTKQGLEKRKYELENTFGKGFRTPNMLSQTLGSAYLDLRTIYINNA